MEISNMFPGLNKITSFFASTTSNTFRHVLSFTSSFNDSRANLIATLSSPSQTQETSASTSNGTLDIESAAPAPSGMSDIPEDESKRVSKSVQPVCLFIASASLVMFVNFPKPAEMAQHQLLYSVNLAFICLSLFTSLGLSMYSVVTKSGMARIAGVQKRVMVMAMAFVLVSVTLRMCVMLPMASLEFAWLFFFLGAGMVTLYLSLTWKGDEHPQVQSSSDAGAADQV